MNTEEKSQKKDKAESGCCGFDGSRMLAMMSECCASRDRSSRCSTMMKDMTETMKKQSCCTPPTEDSGREEGRP